MFLEYNDSTKKLRLKCLFWEKVAELEQFKGERYFELVENIQQSILYKEKSENRKGIYKNVDLLKMHAYKDAIRRTGGAYILYPGDKSINQKGFHEIIPGLGAFPVKPSKSDSGIDDLKSFILEILNHFDNRSSQREKTAFRTYDIHKELPGTDQIINEPMPEAYNNNRELIPDETCVLVGYYKSPEHLEWIKRTKLYNFRMDNSRGALTLTKESISSKFLLLHTANDDKSGELFRIVNKGFRVTSKKTLKRLNYPSPSQKNYLVVRVEVVVDPEFKNAYWEFRKLKNYSKGRASAFPYTANLTELMKSKI